MKYKRLLFAYSGASVGGLLAFILGIGCIIVLRNIMSRARPAVAKIENDLLITLSSAKRRWDREGRESGKDRGPHWHDLDDESGGAHHIDPDD